VFGDSCNVFAILALLGSALLFKAACTRSFRSNDSLSNCIVFADAAEPASTVLLSLVGGRELGFYIFVAAVFAHVSEAAYCYWVLQSLRQPLGACLAWAFLVSLVGWPVTRRVVQLKRVQLKVA
jgi:hypothetical protein